MADEPGDRPDAAEEDGFLTRWSRRKRAARDGAAAPEQQPADAPAEEPPFDPATLPPVESLGPDSDYTLFLRKQVPEALRREALRRLWLSEPSVVNYEPLVDYAWDFTAPGYGALAPGDDVVRLAREVLEGIGAGDPEPVAEERADAPPEQTVETALAPPEPPEIAPVATDLEPRDANREMLASSRPQPRRHGGALPE